MSTEFYNRNWRMPKSSNSSKVSNYSMQFDGSSEFIEIAQASDLEPSNVTVSIWFKGSTQAANNTYLVSKVANSGFQGYALYTGGSTDKLVFFIYNGSTWVLTPVAGSVMDNNWHHAAATFDGTNLKLYVDGSLYSQTTSSSGITYNAGSLIIGAQTSSGNLNFNGKLDHVAIFDYALSASQITSLYGNSTDGVGNPMSISPKPVAYYKLGEKAAFNGSEYLVPNGALQDYVFSFNPTGNLNQSVSLNQSYGYSNITVSTWVKMTSNTNSLIYDNRNDNNNRIFIYYNSLTKKFQWGINNITFIEQGDEGGGDIQLNKWYHVLGTYDETTSKLYVNNISTQVTDSTTVNITSQNATIGALSTVTTILEARAKISNVQIFNTALSATGSNSVQTLYNNGTPLSSMSGFTSLQGWWKLDASATFDGSNWSIPDDSSNSNTGTSNGMTAANLVQSNLNITTPYSRYALDFDVTDDYIDCGTTLNSMLEIGDSFSISAWVKFGSGTTNRTIISNFEPLIKGFQFRVLPNESIRIIFAQSGSAFFFVDSSPLVVDTWHHALFTYDGSNTISGLNLYINNSLDNNSTAFRNVTTITSSSSVDLGRDLDGQLSNVSIWNAALTSTQITEIYNEGKPSNLNNHSAYSNLVSWWQLGENMSYDGTKWTVLDEKGTNNGEGTNLGPAEDSIVNGVATSGNGISNSMGSADNIVGDAPYSTGNAVSYGMGVDALSTDVPS